jgi:prevent-host-death family protein
MNTTQTGATEKTIAAFEARRHFGKLLDEVSRDTKFVVKVHGEKVAALVPLSIYENWKREQETLLALMDEAATNANLSSEDAENLAAAAVKAVREDKGEDRLNKSK